MFEILDERFRGYVLPNAPLLKLADGFAWLEGQADWLLSSTSLHNPHRTRRPDNSSG
jgi:hypothetical protein